MAGQVISRLTSSGGNDAGVHVISSSFYGTCSSAADAENKEVIISNHNIDEHTIDIKACSDEYLLSIIEDDVGSAPLLEHSYDQTQQEHTAIAWSHKFAQSCSMFNVRV